MLKYVRKSLVNAVDLCYNSNSDEWWLHLMGRHTSLFRAKSERLTSLEIQDWFSVLFFKI